MDVGFYLGELLMKQGEVSVPGLGYFVQARISGYYDENERQFYPPYHQVQFDVQSIDDDALAEYIASKKNISVASARYFAEKYITNLKHQALITEVPIGNLGWFYNELSQLKFRPADKIADDNIFYGLEPVKISKANDISRFEEQPKVELNFPVRAVPPKPAVIEEVKETFVQLPAVTEEPINVPAAATYEPQPEPESQISPEFFDPEEEHTTSAISGPVRIVLFVLIGVIVIGLGVLALYRYQPDTFAKITFWKNGQPIAHKVTPIPVAKAADTLDTDTLRPDSPATKKPDSAVQIPAKPKIISTIPASQNPAPAVVKSRVISTTPANQNTAAPAKVKSTVLSVTPVDEGTGSKKKTTVVSQPSVNTGTTADTKKKETAVTKAPAKQNNTATPPVAATAKSTTATTVKPKATPAPVEDEPAAQNGNGLIAKPSDAVGTRRFEVYATTTSSVAEANTAIKKMRKFGLDPRVVTDASGPLIHISIGHFATKQDATDLAIKEIEAGHIPGGNAYGIEINPQK